VFFKDEKTAIEAGYRPCAICMPDEYKEWKNNQDSMKLVHKKSYFE
jgi:methylphosphotriester-DNA--protein-cysteine methyltransferase